MNTTEIKNTEENKAIEYISEKYGKKFIPVFFENADYLSSTKKMQCYTDGMDPEYEYVEVSVTQDGDKKEYRDNYFSYYIRPELEEYVGNMIASEFSEYKVYQDNKYEFVSNELTCENTLEDLYKIEKDYWVDLTVYIEGSPDTTQEEYRMKMDNIEKSLLDSGHAYTIYIYVVSSEVYQTIDRYEQDEFLDFYLNHGTPDGEKYYYLYHNLILNGEILKNGYSE